MSSAVLNESLRTLDMAHLIGQAVRMVHALEEGKAHTAAGKSFFEPDAYARFLLPNPSWIAAPAAIAGMIALAREGRPLNEFLDQWESEAKSLDRFPEMAVTIGDIRRILETPKDEIARLVRGNEGAVHVKIAAAIRLASEDDFDLNEMFYGHAILFDYVRASALGAEMVNSFAELVRKRWRERLRFSAVFPTPRITIPPIATACEDNATGFRLAARILLAARDAVSWRLPPVMLEGWNTAAQ